MPRERQIQVRRGASSVWTSVEPILAPGEMGYDSTNNAIRVGDGVSTWSNLDPIAGSGGGGSADLTQVEADITYVSGVRKTGYEFTSGFLERTTGSAGVSDVGSNFEYTLDMAGSGIWKRFAFSEGQQGANDVPYWSDPTPSPASGIGLFGGDYLPDGVTQIFDFTYGSGDTGFTPSGVTGGGEIYSAASGSFDFKQFNPGDFLQVRFDFNALPQIANTTLEVALIWQTRDSGDNPTYTFALAGQPITFGADTVGETYLNRPILTAYFASEEDVNARALLAIRANNLIQIQPLSTLAIVSRG